MGKHSAVILLRDTKSGQRSFFHEAVTVDDALLIALLRHVLVDLCPAERVVGSNAGRFRAQFATAVHALGLDGRLLRPYSLRRGGATWMFRTAGNMQAIVVRGRWQSERSARLYVMEGMGQLANLKLSAAQVESFQLAGLVLRKICQSFKEAIVRGGIETAFDLTMVVQ